MPLDPNQQSIVVRVFDVWTRCHADTKCLQQLNNPNMTVTQLLIRSVRGSFANPLKSLIKWIAQEAEQLADYATGVSASGTD